MKLYLIAFLLFLFTACHTKKNTPEPTPGVAVPEKDTEDTAANFFPVTAFIKGEIAAIKNKGMAPKIKTKSGNFTDSSFLKISDFQNAFEDFISPVIDTANLKGRFVETKFLDQTLNAFTLTCDPKNNKADSFAYRHWDVYIDADNNHVTRVYLVKNIGSDRQLQLTWQSGKWCKIVTLKTTGDHTEIEREEKISWNYDKE